MQRSLPFPLSSCAFVVLSWFWYQCFIKVAKSAWTLPPFPGQVWQVLGPSGTGEARPPQPKEQGGVGRAWEVRGCPLSVETVSCERLRPHGFVISYTVGPQLDTNGVPQEQGWGGELWAGGRSLPPRDRVDRHPAGPADGLPWWCLPTELRKTGKQGGGQSPAPTHSEQGHVVEGWQGQ